MDIIVDVNIIVRIILNDNPAMAKNASDFIKNNDILIKNEVFAEIVYVLSKYYNMERQDIYENIVMIMKSKRVRTESNIVILCALELYKNRSLDFVDCLLYAYNKILGCKIYTFDDKLNKLLKQD